MRLGAVIVTYNSAPHVGACIDSCLRFAADFNEGIVVVDNASRDATLEEVKRRPAAGLVANHTNLGFAAAVNQGVAALPGAEAFLLLNPDVVLSESPRVLASEFADGQVGAASGMLVGGCGEAQVGFQFRRFPRWLDLVFENLGLNRVWPGNPVNRRYRCLDMDQGVAGEVEQPAGACLLVRREAWRRAGGFDEGFYPLWFEDVDFLKRVTAQGWKVRYTPEFKASHRGGHSIESVTWGERQVYWYGNQLRYASRYFLVPQLWLVCLSVLAGLVPRLVTGMFQQRSSQALWVCGKLVRLVNAHLWKGRAMARRPESASQAVIGECGPTGS